jgi:hypothetical protein
MYSTILLDHLQTQEKSLSLYLYGRTIHFVCILSFYAISDKVNTKELNYLNERKGIQWEYFPVNQNCFLTSSAFLLLKSVYFSCPTLNE